MRKCPDIMTSFSRYDSFALFILSICDADKNVYFHKKVLFLIRIGCGKMGTHVHIFFLFCGYVRFDITEGGEKKEKITLSTMDFPVICEKLQNVGKNI